MDIFYPTTVQPLDMISPTFQGDFGSPASSIDSNALTGLFDAISPVSSASSGFEDHMHAHWSSLPYLDGNHHEKQQQQQHSQSNQYLYPGQLNFQASIAPSVPQSPSTPAPAKLACCTLHDSIKDDCCARNQEDQQKGVKKERRREQNRAAQRAFRARQGDSSNKLRGGYEKLAKEYRSLRISYEQQVEKNVVLESKLQELAEENMMQGVYGQCTWEVFSGNSDFLNLQLA